MQINVYIQLQPGERLARGPRAAAQQVMDLFGLSPEENTVAVHIHRPPLSAQVPEPVPAPPLPEGSPQALGLEPEEEEEEAEEA